MLTQCTNSPAQVLKASGGVGAGTYVWTPTTGLFTDAAATIAYTGAAVDSVYAQPAVTLYILQRQPMLIVVQVQIQ